MGWQDHAPAAGGSGDGSRSWRQPTQGRPSPEPRPAGATLARGKKLFASSLAGVCAVIFWFLLSLFSKGCSSTELFVLTTLDYETEKAGAIPPNWMADSDRTLLQSLEDSRRLLKLSVHSFAKETEFQSQLKDLFAQKSSASRKKTACVIYLSAHAVLEPLLDNSSKESVKVTESDVILLAAGDDFGSKTPRLRLSEVWNALKNLPPDQKKLLLLDLGRLQNRWRLGVFDNFVIEAVQAAVQREKIPNLLVMTACSSGESSWVSPHLGESGQSVFAHFVARGLAGEADRTEGKSDGRVTVLELFRFVRAGVNGWVQRNRDPAGQHPRLFAENFDDEKVRQAKEDTTFSVVTVGTLKSAEPPSSTKSKTPSAEVLDSLLNQLFQLWKRRNTLADPEPGANAMNNLNPAGFRALTQRLFRAEEFLIHHDIARAKTELEKTELLCADLESHLKQGRFSAAGFRSDEKFLKQLSDRFGLGAKPSPPKPASPPAGASEDLSLPDDHLAHVLSHAPQEQGLPWMLKSSEATELQDQLVSLRQLAESVTFGHHTVLPWLRPELKKADQLRRAAEDRFFVTDITADQARRDVTSSSLTPSEQDRTKDKPAEIRELADQATAEFQRLQNMAQDLEKAQFAWNRACATLPEWLAFASSRSTDLELRNLRAELMNEYHRPIADKLLPKAIDLANVGLATKDSRGRSWNELDKRVLSVALEAIELRRLLPLQFSVISPEQWESLKSSTERFLALHQNVRDQFQREAELLRNTSQPQPIHWRLFRDLLLFPNLDAETRRDVFAKLIYLRLDKDVVESPAVEEPLLNDRQTTLWQMFCAIHALSLVPDPTGMANDKLWKAWHDLNVDDSRVSPEPLIQVSRTLRKHWVGHLREAGEECRPWQLESRDLARNSLEQKDLSARILFASDAINLQEKPTQRFERYLIAESLLDASERYLDDFWKGWYDRAAQSCFNAAARLGDRILDKDQRRVNGLLAVRAQAELALEAAPVVFGTQKSAPGSVRIRHTKDLPVGLATTWLNYKDGDPRAAGGGSLALFCSPRSLGLPVRNDASSHDAGRFAITHPDASKPSPAIRCQPSQIVPQVFFRGHAWKQQTAAIFNPCKPDGTLIRRLATPITAAIRVSGEDRKSVVFVLDASGSMLPDANEAKQNRWIPAKAILLEVLNDLLQGTREEGTKPHQVELIVYGHRDPATQVLDRANVKTELPMTTLTDATIAQVRAKLEGFEPFGSTPLLTAVTQACNSLTKSKTPGTIIVITDGVPNDGARWIQEKLDYNYEECRPILEKRKEEIKLSVNQARSDHREIELQVIGLGFQGAALPNELAAREELEQLVKEANQRTGNFHRAATFDELRGKLNLATGARHFFVGQPGSPSKLMRDKPLSQTLSDLPSGQYRMVFADPNRMPEGLPVELKGGELLDFRLTGEGEFDHVHPLALRSSAGFARAQTRANYRIGSLQSLRLFENRAELVVGIQNLPPESSRPAAYTERPDRLLIEIWPKNQPQKKVSATTYQIEPGKSDPTWTITVDDWLPSDTEAQMTAYASWGKLPHDALLISSDTMLWPKKVEVPVSKTDRVSFQVEVLTPPNDRVDLEDAVEVRLRLSDPADAPRLTKDWRHLAYLQVELRDEDQPIPHLDETAEVLATEHEVRWKFSNLPKENFSSKRLKIAVTSWQTFQQSALSLEQPISIKAE